MKIDQRFVHGLEKNRNDEAITQAIIALSHSLGLKVIAEGVETVAQFEFLRTHGDVRVREGARGWELEPGATATSAGGVM